MKTKVRTKTKRKTEENAFVNRVWQLGFILKLPNVTYSLTVLRRLHKFYLLSLHDREKRMKFCNGTLPFGRHRRFESLIEKKLQIIWRLVQKA